MDDNLRYQVLLLENETLVYDAKILRQPLNFTRRPPSVFTIRLRDPILVNLNRISVNTDNNVMDYSVAFLGTDGQSLAPPISNRPPSMEIREVNLTGITISGFSFTIETTYDNKNVRDLLIEISGCFDFGNIYENFRKL